MGWAKGYLMAEIEMYDASSRKKVRVIACGMIAREVLAVNAQLGHDHVDLKCIDANFHHYPDRIAPAVDLAIRKARDEGYEHVFIGYADCGTGGEKDVGAFLNLFLEPVIQIVVHLLDKFIVGEFGKDDFIVRHRFLPVMHLSASVANQTHPA